MQNLINSLTLIDNQLELSVTLMNGAVGYAMVGGVIEDGALDEAKISEAMLLAYQSAQDAVLNRDFAVATNAQELFLENYNANMDDLALAVDSLADATADLAMATGLIEVAATADTRPEQAVLQSMAGEDQYTITAEKVDAYNDSIDAVASYAQAAGAYMAASQDGGLTASVDSYVATNGIVIGAYTAIDFVAATDEFLISWDLDGFGSGWSGYMTEGDNFKTAAEVFGLGEEILAQVN